MAETKKKNAAKAGKKNAVKREEKPMSSKLLLRLTTPRERKKIIGKILPSFRAGADIDFEDIGLHCKPNRDARTIKKVYTKYMKGELWNRWGPQCQPEHEPVHVNRLLQDLLAEEPLLSLHAQAKRLGILWSTFRGILKKARSLPLREIVFSRGNPAFKDIYKQHLHIVQHELWAAWFVLTDLEVLGVLLELAKTCKVRLLLDWHMCFGPFELPLLGQLLDAGVELFVLKRKSTIQHQKMVIVDDAMASLGSANPSKNGLEHSFEFVTYRFDGSSVDKCRKEFEEEIALARQIDRAWLQAELAKLTEEQRLAAAVASEGLTKEEQEELARKKSSPEAQTAKAAKLRERKLRAAECEHSCYEARVEAGMCTQCNAPLTEKDDCKQCLACRRAYQFKRNLAEEHGACKACKKPKPADGFKLCVACHLRDKQYRLEQLGTKEEDTCHKASCHRKRAVRPSDGFVYARCKHCNDANKRSLNMRYAARAAAVEASEWTVLNLLTEENVEAAVMSEAAAEMERARAKHTKRKRPPGECNYGSCGKPCDLKLDGMPYNFCPACYKKVMERCHRKRGARRAEKETKYAAALEQERLHPTHKKCKRAGCPDDCVLKRDCQFAKMCRLHLGSCRYNSKGRCSRLQNAFQPVGIVRYLGSPPLVCFFSCSSFRSIQRGFAAQGMAMAELKWPDIEIAPHDRNLPTEISGSGKLGAVQVPTAALAHAPQSTGDDKNAFMFFDHTPT